MPTLRIFWVVAPLILILDQLTKWALMEMFLRPEGQQVRGLFSWILFPPDRLGPDRIEIFPFFNIVMVWNEGVSFGLFGDGHSEWQPYFLSALALIICCILFFWLLNKPKPTLAIALSVIIGGALGNVLDRLRFGAVADFFDFHVAGWHYPAFNIADSAIVLGVAYLAIDAVFFDKSNQNHIEQPK